MPAISAAARFTTNTERLNGDNIVSIAELRKSYGATVALRDVSLRIARGEVRALLGENGAGKSTLVKILSGIVKPDSGRIEIDSIPFRPDSLLAARAAGISTAFQELSLLPNLTVADNLSLPRLVKGFGGRAWVSANRRAAVETLAHFGARDIAPDAMVGDLSLAQKQRIEIVRALSRWPRLLILDEPTAALAEPEWLFQQVERLAAGGTAVLYITHRLAEVRRLCARATILRNGENVDTIVLADTNDAEIFRMMVGAAPAPRSDGSTAVPHGAVAAVAVRGLRGGAVGDISFDLQAGEILGVAALEGQGQRDLFRMLAGAAPIAAGTVFVNGHPIDGASPPKALRAGIVFLPEERKTEGVFLGLGVIANISLSILNSIQHFGIINQSRERKSVAEQARRVDLAERFLGMQMAALSGGNQQKALLARVLLSGAQILVLFDPTRGVDVGTKQVIYDVIRRFSASGGSVLIYSTELEELVQLVERCLVIYRGCVVGEVSGPALSEDRLIALASGHSNSDAAKFTQKTSEFRTRPLTYLSKSGAVVAAAVFLALFASYAALEPGALALSSITALCNNALPVALAAAGGTVVVLTRGFDLSVAGVVAVSNVLIATSSGNGQWAPLLALAMAAAVGLAIGIINAVLVAYIGLQSVTATLATMIVCSGAALLILPTPGGHVPAFISDDLTDVIAGRLPISALIGSAVALLWLTVRRTDWGVALYAVGADETAAQLAGISIRRVKLLAYCLAGIFYGLAGYALTALTASGDPNSGNAYLVMVFAAIAIGGTSFNGGRGGLIGSIIGAATLTLLIKVLFSMGVLSFATGIAQGLIMILAVLLGAQAVRLARWRRGPI